MLLNRILYYLVVYCNIFLHKMIYYLKRWCKNMKPLKEKVSITLDAEIIELIKELADNDDRSFSQYVNIILKDHINSLKK